MQTCAHKYTDEQAAHAHALVTHDRRRHQTRARTRSREASHEKAGITSTAQYQHKVPFKSKWKKKGFLPQCTMHLHLWLLTPICHRNPFNSPACKLHLRVHVTCKCKAVKQVLESACNSSQLHPDTNTRAGTRTGTGPRIKRPH